MAASPSWGSENVMQSLGLSPDILALGDSWFCHPNNDLMIPISSIRLGVTTVLVKGRNGAEMRETVGGTPRLWRMLRELDTNYRKLIDFVRSVKPKVLP